MIINFKLFERYRKNKYDIEKGDLVKNHSNQIGLIVSNKYITDDEFKEEVIDVYYRMMNGDIYEEIVDDLIIPLGYEIDDHIDSYISIAKKNNYIINIPEGEYADNYPKEYAAMKVREKTREFNI